MTSDDFAAAVKAKHPEYESVDNTELTNRMMEKYPQYKSSVEFSKPEAESSPKFYELEKQQGLPQHPMDVVKQAGKQYLEAALSPMPGSLLSVPAKAMQENAQQAGAEVAKKTIDKIGAVPARGLGLAASVALDPTSYLSGALTAKPAKLITNEIGEMAAKRLPGIFKFLAKVPEQATKVLTENKGILPEATPQIEEALTQRVQKALTQAVETHGKALNDAKEAVGLPVSVDARVKALKDTGNVFGVGPYEVQQMAESFGQKYGPKTHLKKLLGEWAQDYLTNPEVASKKIEEMLKLNTRKENEVLGWFPNDEIRGMFQKELFTKLDEFKSFAHFDEIKKPQDLVKAVDNFNQMAEKIPEKTRVKMASLLQDKINGMVDWTKQGDTVEGLLKNQYKQLDHVAIPDSLSASKESMHEALDVMNDLEKKIGGDEGKAQQFLDKIFTNPTPANTDYIKKLGKLEAVSKQPILTDLYKHFASKAFGHHISRPVFEGMEGAYGAGRLMKGDLTGAAKMLAIMTAQSPKALKGLTRLGYGAANVLPKAGLMGSIVGASRLGVPLSQAVSEQSQRALQSAMDRLKNGHPAKRPAQPSSQKK